MRDASLSLLPDFVRGPVIMSLPVGFVRILVGVKILVGMLMGQFARPTNRAIGPVARIGVQNVGAIAQQNLLALARDVFWHAQRDRESFGCAQHGISDAGVAAGGIEQNLPGPQLTAAAGFGPGVGGGGDP